MLRDSYCPLSWGTRSRMMDNVVYMKLMASFSNILAVK